MKKYYTRVCNFFYGGLSIKLVNQKKTLPLRGNKKISFNNLEIISRDSMRRIGLKDIEKLPQLQKKKLKKILKLSLRKIEIFQI